MNRAKGEALASLYVTSPCFLPPGQSGAATTADPVVLETPPAG